jgi:hypothetical protein
MSFTSVDGAVLVRGLAIVPARLGSLHGCHVLCRVMWKQWVSAYVVCYVRLLPLENSIVIIGTPQPNPKLRGYAIVVWRLDEALVRSWGLWWTRLVGWMASVFG